VKSTQEKIKQLEDRADALHKELQGVEAEIFDLKTSLCPVKVGDVVSYRGLEFKVTEIDRPEWSWVYANPRKKDGSWGTAKRHLLGNLTVVVPSEERS
jgi:hypothetical protein